MKTFTNSSWTNENGPCSSGGFFTSDSCIGMVKIFKHMKTVLPGGDALFTFIKYVATEHEGVDGNEHGDDLFMQSVEFYSYPSVVENRNFYLIRRNQPGSSDAVNTYYNNSDKQISHIFPIKVDD